MPIVTLTVRKPKTADFIASVLGAIHAALVEIGVNPNDRFHRVLELEPDAFLYDPTFPDARTPRDENFVLIEILLGVGRSTKVKRGSASQPDAEAVLRRAEPGERHGRLPRCSLGKLVASRRSGASCVMRVSTQ